MSIRELTELDRESTMEFLEKHSSFNIFIIGDIFNYGFERDFQQVWGDFDSSGELRAVLLRYYANYLPYAPREFDIDGFVEIMEKAKNIGVLAATEEMVGYFDTFPSIPLDWSTKKTLYLSEVDHKTFLLQARDVDYTIRRMTVDDVENVVKLHASIEEFNIGPLNQISLLHSLETGSGRGYVVDVEGKIVAMAQTVAENPYAAMLIGVGTDVNYRNQGLASALVSRLCQELVAEGKKVCLSYDNPQAGTIYKRLGFRDIGFWSVVQGQQKEDVG